MMKNFKNGLCLLLVLCVGCTSLPKGDIHAKQPKASTHGFTTYISGEKMNGRQAAKFYREAGAEDAAELMERGIAEQKARRTAVVSGIIVGAVAGLVGGLVAVNNDPSAKSGPGAGYAGEAVGATLIGGAGLATVIGLPFIDADRHKALPDFRAAAEAYNRALDAGTVKPVPAEE
jgi:hypothetical protein